MSHDNRALRGKGKDLRAPIPIRGHISDLPRPRSLIQLNKGNGDPIDQNRRYLTPSETDDHPKDYRQSPLYKFLGRRRGIQYNLDYPDNWEDLSQEQLDPKSKLFARERPRTLNLPQLLPYEVESPAECSRFLSHIVSHLYIAIKTLDLQGSLSVTAKDLAALEDFNGLTDVDLALETNLFEIGTAQCHDSELENDNESGIITEDFSDSEYDEDEVENDVNGSEDAEAVNQHKRSPQSAAIVSVRIWTHELLVWLRMKYDMPLSLRMRLARVYYAICMSRGQGLSLRIYVKTFETLTKDVSLLQKYGFYLDWKDLCQELQNTFASHSSTQEQFEKKDQKLLHRLAERASNFFDAEALPIIYSKLVSNFSIPNANAVLSSLSLLPLKFNKEGVASPYDIRHYVASIFYFWVKLSKSTGIDTHITSRLGTIAMESLFELHRSPSKDNVILQKFGIFSQEQMKLLFNFLLNSLGIMNTKYSSLKAKFFHGFSSCIVFSIVGERCLEPSGIMEQIESLVKAVESYVHPSNSGDWSRPISKLISSLVYQFQKRLELESRDSLMSIPQAYKITSKVTSRFVNALLPVVLTGIHSKKSSCVDDYLSSLQLLAHLNSTFVLENVLLDIYESLEGVISTHRVTTAIRSIEALSRYFASTPIFRVHVTRLISMTLSGIDSNDLSKSIHTLDMLASCANFVPFYNLTDGYGDSILALQVSEEHLNYLQQKRYNKGRQEEFVIEPEIEIEALKSSTTLFKDIIKSLCERVCTVLENLPDPSKSSGIEKDLADTLPRFLVIIFEALSKENFAVFRECFFKFVFSKTLHTVAEIVAEICGGLIRVDPRAFKDICQELIERIHENIEDGAGSSRTGVEIIPRDRSLFWNLVILNECVGNASGYVRECSRELMDLSMSLMKVRGSTIFAGSYLLNQILQSCTKMKLRETRLISPKYESKYGVNEKCWGAFQFDDYRFSRENLTFDWYIPDSKDIDFAANCLSDHVKKALSNISSVMKKFSSENIDQNDDLSTSDELRVNLLYLGYAISGSAYLFDPSFSDDIPKLTEGQPSSISQRLYLLKSLRESVSDTSHECGELRSVSFHENLNQIVNYFDGELDDLLFENANSSRNFWPEGKSEIDEHEKDDSSTSRIIKDFGGNGKSVSNENSSEGSVDSSTRATPAIEEFEISTMNPAVTFRERKLYTSNYTFGHDIEDRKSNEVYLKVHSIRHLVGKSLHIIAKFLILHFFDNVKLMKHFLHSMNLWFADIGRERLLDSSHASVSYGYIRTIQRINKIRKPYTRIALGARLESYHQLRVILHATSKSQTNLDRVLLQDVVKLSSSTYLAVATLAQATLVDAMRRLNGSYNVIVKFSLDHLTSALKENNHKKIASVLNIFGLKKVKAKVQNDYFNLSKLVTLLFECLQVDNIEVDELAVGLLQSITVGVAAPGSICLLNEKETDAIRPSDNLIDIEINAVKLAKEKKRRVYLEKLSKLEDVVLEIERSNSYWKTTTLTLPLLTAIQSNFEIATNAQVLQLVVKMCSSDHPLIARVAIKGMAKLFGKFRVLSVFDYDMSKAFDLQYAAKDTEIIDTTPKNGKSFTNTWKQRIDSFKDINYYVDGRSNKGWLFWDDQLEAVSNKPSRMALKESDEKALEGVESLMTLEWFKSIVKLWVTNNEINSAFQGTDVLLISTLIELISNRYAKNMKFKDVLEIIDHIYISDEKSSHVVSCELIAGVLMGSKYLEESLADERDTYFKAFFVNLFTNDLSPDNRGVWNIFSWWIPSHVDFHRFPKVTEILTQFTLDDSIDSTIRQATRLSYLRSFIAATTWCFPHGERILDLCLLNVNNPYQAIRDQIGSLLATLTFSTYNDSLGSGEEFVEYCNTNQSFLDLNVTGRATMLEKFQKLFEQIESWREETKDLSPSEVLKSNYIFATTTVLTWLKQVLSTSAAFVYQGLVSNDLIPFLLKLTNMKDVCQLGNIEPISVFKKVSHIPYDNNHIEVILGMLEKYSKGDLTMVQLFIMGEFTETFYFKNNFRMDRSQRHRVMALTNTLLYHKYAEVRDSAANTFSGLVHLSSPNDVEELVSLYSKKYTNDLSRIRRKNKSKNYKSMDSEDLAVLHAATLGLGALINAFPFASPPPLWVPDLLTILVRKSSGIPGLVGKTAKDILGKFKKNRQDTWHIDSKIFNEQHVEDLEGVLWKSYFI